MRKLTTQEFIDHARSVHGDKYSYAFSVYQTNKKPLFIYCRKHGMFSQLPHLHVIGTGCPKCGYESLGNKKRHSQSLFIKKAQKIHGKKYDYSQVEYKGSRTKISIICRHHGVFEQLPGGHLHGNGCIKCAHDETRFNVNQFIERATLIHGNKYDYSLVIIPNIVTGKQIGRAHV